MSTTLLKLLEFNFSQERRNQHVKLLDEIMYFLLSKLDPAGMKVWQPINRKEAQFCWPICDARQSQEFKSICLKILEKLYSQGKIKTQFKKFNYDITKCEVNIIELCVTLIKSRLKSGGEQSTDQLKHAVQVIIQDRCALEENVEASSQMLHNEIQELKTKLNSFNAEVVLDEAKRCQLANEKQELSLLFNQELAILQSKIDRMNRANNQIVNLSEKKHVLGKMDLVFSKGKALTQFQEYMTTENMEPFKDGKLDLVVFFKLYKILLEGIIDHLKSSESQIAVGAKSLPQLLVQLQNLSKLISESNSNLNVSLSREEEHRERHKSQLKGSCDIKNSQSRQFIMDSSITICDGIQPLEMKEVQQLDLHVIESLNSSLDSMLNEKRANILPAKKSDIMKKLARSILSSRKKPTEQETDNIFGNFSFG